MARRDADATGQDWNSISRPQICAAGRATSGTRRAHELAQLRRRRRAGRSVVVAFAVVGLPLSGGGGSSGPARADGQSHGGRFFAEIAAGRRRAGSFAATQRRRRTPRSTEPSRYTPAIRIAGSQHREMALTFDDGPGPYTLQLLAVLVAPTRRRRSSRSASPSSTSMPGRARSSSSATRSATTPGATHMAELSRSEQRGRAAAADRAIGQYGAPFPRLFRPP